MLTAIKIVLIIGILGVLVLVGGIALVLRWLRNVVKSATTTAGCPPCRVHPKPEPNPQWRTPAKIDKYASGFRALGFQEIGAFSIPEMGGLGMLAFVHTEKRLYGVIYDHTQIAPTFDIGCDFEDKTDLTVTSSKAGATLDKRPGHAILWLGNDSVQAVFEAVEQHAQTAPRVPVSVEGFLPHFCRHYAESMNWRMKKGGVSRDEIRRQAESRGQKLSDEALTECYNRLRKAHVTELQRGCLAQYLDEAEIPAAEWERVRNRTFAIPETLEAPEVLETLESVLSLDQEQRHDLGKLRKSPVETALEFVDQITREKVAGLGLIKVGEVQEPVRAYVLQGPAREEAPKALAACV